MLNCCNPERGFFAAFCEKCNKGIVMHLKCNGKACTRCGTKYVDNLTKKAKRKVGNANHRLVTLTVSADLRRMLFQRWDLPEDFARKCISDFARSSI